MKGDEIIFYSIKEDLARFELQMAVLRQTLCTFPFSKFKSLRGGIALIIQKNYERNLAVAMLSAYLGKIDLEFEIPDKNVFWKTNHSDFQMHGQSWVVMNKTMRSSSILKAEDFVFLPALIPNRFEDDRWGQKILPDGKVNHFVFTFLRQVSAGSSKLGITLPQNVLSFLRDLSVKYQAQDLLSAPYTLDWFWNKVDQLGGILQNFQATRYELVICGIADSNFFKYFSDTDGYSEFSYALYTGKWYDVESDGALVFRNGALQTHFKNATCPMAALPSFLGQIRDKVG